MPAPEQEGSGTNQEREPTPCYQAASYQNERPALKAYRQLERLAYSQKDLDLSVYRILLNQFAHVVALGQEPPLQIHQRIQQILAAGTASTRPADVLAPLLARRAEASTLGPWVEGYDRPGKRIEPR